MLYNGLGLMITDRCNAACAFCGLKCGPDGKNVISRELAERLIDEISAMDFETVAVTGGEPFLYPELMFEILEYAKKAGIEKKYVATNCFWGGWDDKKLNETAKRLKECVDHVSISFDSFHAEYVPEASIWRAVDVLKKNKIEYRIYVADVYGKRGAGPFIASLGEKGMYNVFNIIPLGPYGNAASLPSDLFVKMYHWNETACNPMGILSVGPDGTVYPCCSPAVVETGLSLGNVRDTSLSELLSKKENLRLADTMSKPAAFQKLLTYVKEELGAELPEEVIEGCELCNRIFKDPEISKRALEYLDQFPFDHFLACLLEKKIDRNGSKDEQSQ